METIQREWLNADIKRLMFNLELDYRNQDKFSSDDDFSYAKEKLISGHIIQTHTYIEYLIVLWINNYFNEIDSSDELIQKIVEDEKIKTFNHHLLEELSFKRKLDLWRAIHLFTDDIYNKISRINTLRNKVAHNFVFELSKKSWWSWIEYLWEELTWDWILLFINESDEVIDFLERGI